MRRSQALRKLLRRQRRPSELTLVSMIDIFTVLVTFLLMTAIFSRTVVLDLKLPSNNASFPELPKGLNLEIIIRDNLLQIADRGTGPLRTLPNTPQGYDLDGLTEYLKFVKSRYPDKTEATILLEPQTPYDTLVQVMDRTRVVEVNAGLSTLQAELFPEVSIGDAPVAVGNAGAAP
ncbi:MAG TPA: biopolymer transporter ExbD [Steroidobacteraceae bacterium]|nr:biopolymer transporter ExbD [Steroidobacteraceae bacterium]